MLTYILLLSDVQLSTEEQRILAMKLKMPFSKLPQGGGLEKVAHGVVIASLGKQFHRNWQQDLIFEAIIV